MVIVLHGTTTWYLTGSSFVLLLLLGSQIYETHVHTMIENAFVDFPAYKKQIGNRYTWGAGTRERRTGEPYEHADLSQAKSGIWLRAKRWCRYEGFYFNVHETLLMPTQTRLCAVCVSLSYGSRTPLGGRGAWVLLRYTSTYRLSTHQKKRDTLNVI